MIEGTDMYEYFLCPYKVYNRHNRDHKLMVVPSDFTKRIMELGRDHEKELVSHLTVVQPKYSRRELEEGFAETLKLMKAGTPIIYQGVLMHDDCMGIPDLLIKQEGTSVFGNHAYIAADIKIAAKSKDQHVMQVMFYDYLLERIQKTSLNEGRLMLKNYSEIVLFDDYKEQFSQALAKVREMTKGTEYGLHIDAVCKECPWKEVCIPLAEERHDVSLIYGLSRPLHYRLLEKGIKTYEDLQQADPTMLEEVDGIGTATVQKWKKQSEALITQKDFITPLQLPNVKHHICLDIESSEDGFVYLIGLWHNDAFVYFFSEDDEKKNVEKFVDYLLSLESYRLYHYGNIEKTTFRELFTRYEIPQHIAHDVLGNMIDLFTLVKKHAVLPLSFYSLKEVAKHFGFKWRASDASGGNSMVWFDEWKKTKDSELLKKILAYNEDDVKGTDIILKKLSS